MKLVLKIFAALVLIIIIAMITIPYFFRDQIVEVVKEEINKNINAKVDFVDFDLSLFRSFPNFDFRIQGLSVLNNSPFEGDTLAYVPSFSLTLDLMSVIGGEAYELRKINISQPVINALVKEDGRANWDITIESGGEEQSSESSVEAETNSPFLIKLRSVTITGARIVYDDKSLLTYALLDGVDHHLSGDFTMDNTNLKTSTSIEALTVVYDGVKYFNKIDTELDAVIGADLVNYIFSFEKNELRLNQLFVGFDGSVALQDNGDINLMLTYASRRSDFKNFLSLVPAIYATDFDGLKTSGTLELNGNVKGIYNDVTYPTFALNLQVKDGYFQYPDLPKAVEGVNIETKIAFPGGDLDNLTIDVPKFEMTMAGNHLAASLFIHHPMTDVDLKGGVNGKLDLSKVKDVYPLEAGDELSGDITSNVSFEGKMSSLENEKYDEFLFLGSVLLEDIEYSTSYLPEKVHIKKGQLNFSPQYLDLVTFNMNIGKSNFLAKGRIEQFMPYIFADKTLLGNLETTSSYLNITELMPADAVENDSTQSIGEPQSTSDPEIVQSDTSSMGVMEIPGNIHFTLSADYQKVIYDNIELSDMHGELIIKDKTLTLNQLKMLVLDGTLVMSGEYDTRSSEKPFTNMDFDLSDIDIQQAYHSFGAFQKFAPIAEKTEGKFSSSFSMNTLLDSEMIPVYSSMNGGGNLQTSAITVSDVNSVNKLADLLKMPDLKRLQLSPIKLAFEFVDGKLNVKPFDVKFQDMQANVGGWTSFDQSIHYDMIMAVPRSKFGGQANAILDNLVKEANKSGTDFSLGETVKVSAVITGTATNPKVKLLPGDVSGSNMGDDLKLKAKQELDKQKQKLKEGAQKELDKQKVDVQKEADKIMADAEKQVNKAIADAQKQVDANNKAASESAQKGIEEAQKQIDKLMKEAKKNGPLAEMTAKVSSEKIMDEALENSNDIVAAAEKKSDGIMKTARDQAAKIKSDAQKRADKLLE